MLKGIRGISKDFVKDKIKEYIFNLDSSSYLNKKVMSVTPSYTIASGFTISGGINFPASKEIGTPTQVIIGDMPWNYIRGGNLKNTNGYITYNNIANETTKNIFAISFMHDGSALEIEGYAGIWNIKINDEYMTSSPITLSGNQKIYIPFGSSDVRRIDIFGSDTANFRSIQIGATDSIWKSEIRGPRVMVLGDSVTACKSGSPVSTNRTLDAWTQWFADFTRWDDVWNCGHGGTGFYAGSPDNYLQRIDKDIIPYSPDILIVTGSPNDASQGYTNVYNNAYATLKKLKESLPDTIIVVIGTYFYGGQGKWYDTINSVSTKATQNAATELNIPFYNYIERPFRDGYTPVEGTLAANTSIGATSFTSSAVFSPMACVEIESNDRAQIKTVTGTGTGPFTYTIDSTLKVAHTSGVAIKEIGRSFWTGTGYIGATTGWGNSDLYVQADGVHPTIAGYKAIGINMIYTLKQLLKELL